MLHIEIERERKFNICIEIQSHAQHISPLLSEHIFLPIVCAYTSPIVMEFYLFCSIAVSAHIDTNWLISLSLLFTFHYRNNLKQIFAMKEKDTKNNSETPIVIKIEAPKEAMKKNSQNHEKKVEDDNLKPTSSKSKCCQFLPILLFLVTLQQY